MIEPGQVLQNRYLVSKQIGAGGMGTVYVATDRRFGSVVAIKETLFTDPGLRRAFEREAQLLNSLRHPALPRVSDHFAENERQFIVMEYIAGEDLSAMVEAGGAFASSDVLHWADQLLDALDYLHNQKFPVVHRDIKPQNLKLTARGDIVLLDFGLAKGSASELSQVSLTKSIFGYSRAYAPLEQIQGTGTDPRSDLYSLAATLYHLLTGKPPVDALTRATAVLNGNEDPLRAAHRLNPKIHPAVSNVLLQAMTLNANLRPATAAKMRLALTEAPQQLAEASDLDEATVIAAAVFSQKTKLMNSPDDGVKTAVSPVPNETAAQPISQSTAVEPPLETSAPVVAQIPQLNSKDFAPRRVARVSPFGIAAAIILLSCGAFAAWYGLNSPTASSIQPETNKLNVLPEITAQEPPTVTPAATSDNAVMLTNQPTNKNSTLTAAAAPPNKPGETLKSESAKQQSPQTAHAPPATPKPKTPTEKSEEDFEKELEAEVEEAIKMADNLEKVPPEFRSKDPKNPVDQEKLKIYVRKKQEAAMRHHVDEVNRRRAEKGLPPLEGQPPLPPRPRRFPRSRGRVDPKN